MIIRRLCGKSIKQRNYAIGEVVSIMLHYLFFYTLLNGSSNPVSRYFFIVAISSSYIFVNFAISHTHLPVTQKEENLDWVEYSAYHTTNVGYGHPFVCWWMSNLNFQIEHHLFPSMPQVHHRKISKRVQKFFAENGLPYQDGGYFELLSKTFDNLGEVGQSKSKLS